MEWGAFLAKLRTKEQDLFALSWMAGNEDPDMVMYPLLHSSQWTPNGPNRALYKNDALRRAPRTRRGRSTDEAKRPSSTARRSASSSRTRRGCSWTTRSRSPRSRKRVQGFKLHPSFDLRVETISVR